MTGVWEGGTERGGQLLGVGVLNMKGIANRYVKNMCNPHFGIFASKQARKSVERIKGRTVYDV